MFIFLREQQLPLTILLCYKLTHVNLKRNPMVETIVTEYFSTHCDHTITSLPISFSGTPSPFSKTSLQNPAFFQCPRNLSTFHSSIPLIIRFLSLTSHTESFLITLFSFQRVRKIFCLFDFAEVTMLLHH